MSDETLTEALLDLGYRHEPGKFGKRRIIRVDTDECIGWMDSSLGWEFVAVTRAGDNESAGRILSRAAASRDYFEPKATAVTPP